jgi:hypothetical protein
MQRGSKQIEHGSEDQLPCDLALNEAKKSKRSVENRRGSHGEPLQNECRFSKIVAKTHSESKMGLLGVMKNIAMIAKS